MEGMELSKKSTIQKHQTLLCFAEMQQEILPPMVVYKAMFLNDGWASAGLNGAIYHSPDSGCFDRRTFKQWFKELFVLNLNGTFAIIGDNLGSHFREEFIELYSKKKHTLYNTSTFGPVRFWPHGRRLEEPSK